MGREDQMTDEVGMRVLLNLQAAQAGISGVSAAELGGGRLH